MSPPVAQPRWIRDSLAELIDLLDIARHNADRAEALALFISSPETARDFARFLAARAHLIVRGGPRALLREMLSTIASSEAEVSVFADIAEEHLQRSHESRDFGIHFVRVASTRAARRPDARGPLVSGPQRWLTIETHGHEVGALQFSPDGTRILAFASSIGGWDPAPGTELRATSVAQWDVATGRFVGATRAGQFREGDGAMGINPAMTLAVVRSHREMAVHAMGVDGQVEPRALRRISLYEGPDTITFLDDRTLVANDAYGLIVADAEDGNILRRASSVGRAFVFSREHQRIFVGGSHAASTSIAMHDVASPALAITGSVVLERASKAPAGDRWLIETIALSPSEDTLATGDWHNEVRLWDVGEVMRAGEGAPRAVPVRSICLGEHRGWVSASAFVDDDQLLTAGWDGALIAWDLRKREAVRHAYEHHGYITALTLDARHRRAATGASDGNIVIWDLDGDPSGDGAPPFVVSHGGHRAPITVHVGDETVRIALGTREAFFDRRGRLLRSGDCAHPPEYRGPPSHHERVEGFTSDAIELELEAFDQPEAEWACREDAPSIVVSRDGSILDVLGLDAPALTFAWMDTRSFLVLDRAGHVELWSLRSSP